MLAGWPTDVTAELFARLPLGSLRAAAAVCRAWHEAVDNDAHWHLRYLYRWQPTTVDSGDWRSKYLSAHQVDGILYACGLRASPGDDGPTHLGDAAGRPVEAAPHSAMPHRLRFTQAVPGAKHFLGLSSEGVLYAWGSPRGLQGSGVSGHSIHRAAMGIPPRIGQQISIPTEVATRRAPRYSLRSEPESLDRAAEIKQIHIGGCGEQSCALVTQGGDMYYFGRKTCYMDECAIASRIGIPDPATPLAVRVASVALGANHGLLVDITGRVFSFGSGEFGQNGFFGIHPVLERATLLDSLADEGVGVISVAAGMNHSLCLSEDGEVYAFGDGRRGQIGCDTLSWSPRRVMVPKNETSTEMVVLSDVTAVSAGFNLSAFVTADGALYTCGQANEGGLGHGGSAADLMKDAIFPRRISKLASHHVTCVSVGGGHMAALTADGAVFSWGNNDHGQCGRRHVLEDLELSIACRGCNSHGPLGLSVYDVAQVVLPARARFVCAGDTATFFILGEPLA